MTMDPQMLNDDGDVQWADVLRHAQLPADTNVAFVSAWPQERQRTMAMFLRALSDLERIGFGVAHTQLQSSFDIARIQGFVEFEQRWPRATDAARQALTAHGLLAFFAQCDLDKT